MIKMNLRPALQRERRVIQHFDLYVQAGGERHAVRLRHRVAPPDPVSAKPNQIQRRAHSRRRLVNGPVMALNTAYPGLFSAGIDGHRLSCFDGALHQRAGDHRTKAVDRENPVDRKPERTDVAFFFRAVHQRDNLCLQLVDSLTGIRTDGDHGRVFQKRSLHIFPDFLQHGLQPFLLHHVYLCDHDNSALDAQQRQNSEVFSGLRHESLVRRHYQQHDVHSGRTHQHIPDKAFMPRHIHDAGFLSVWQRQLRKAVFNGNPSLLLFLQAVGIDPGQRFCQAGFSMVHMPCGSNDDVLHICSLPFVYAGWHFAVRSAVRERHGRALPDCADAGVKLSLFIVQSPQVLVKK
ncbi:hypothetical protein SDC9_81312 [bioreactor metagenome]|uniref:Uncharacterized protein n=1 Tax=bioreactor metagenome TaxID=1076179 RepID=A0A644Z1F6_9ZZZZ